MTFLDYYRANLDHIRGIASEFAAEFPKIAARLELSEQNCQDPYVERLLEGAAFLAARVENKLDRGFPRLMETVLASATPLAISPVPSYSVLQLKSDVGDERLASGYVLPAGSAFRASVDGVRTPCVFTTLSDVSLSSATLSDVRYLTRELGDWGISSPAALVVTLSPAVGRSSFVSPDSYTFYIDLPEGEASMLQGQLIGDIEGIYVRVNGEIRRLVSARTSVPAYDDQPPDGCGALHGLATIQRFFACPHLFKFIRVDGLSDVGSTTGFELLFAFRRREPLFFRSVRASTLRLDCAAVANVFPRRSDRTEYRGDFEHHVVPDRSAPRDYEVFRVLSAETYDERNQPLFVASDTYDSATADHFVPHRREHPVHPGNARSSYHGSEVFLSFAGAGYQECRGDMRQFGAQLLCTNRDLPLLLRIETPLTGPAGMPVPSASFLVQPSVPRPPAIAAAARSDWEKLSHLTFNLSSMLWKNGTMPLGILKDLLRSYVASFGDEAERLADGVHAIDSRPRIFRFIRTGAVYFENGWEIRLLLDETVCAGSGVFAFAMVLKELLFAYVPLGSCVEIVIDTDKRRGVYRWRS